MCSVVLGALLTMSCGSDSDSGPTVIDPEERQIPADTTFSCPGVTTRLAPELPISDLTDEEIGCYCDWATSVTAGGYNIRLNCPPGAEFYTHESRSACIRATRKQTMTCPLSAQAAIDCILEQVDDPCNTFANLLSDACRPLLECSL